MPVERSWKERADNGYEVRDQNWERKEHQVRPDIEHLREVERHDMI